MKKLILLCIVALLFTLPSCDNCSGCEKDVELSICMENSIPYQIGDTIKFRSNLSDTLVLACTERKYFQNQQSPRPGRDYECCPFYESENLSTKLIGENGYLNMSTQYVAVDYYLNFDISINGEGHGAEWYACHGYKMATVTLAQRVFHNVIGLSFYNKIDSLYINSEDQYGVVGFKVDGVEWAKID